MAFLEDSSLKTPIASILLFLAASVLGAVGQYLYKSGADAADGSIAGYLNARILGGAAAYIAVMVLFVAAFRRGGQLGVLYPVYATTFIWAALIGLAVYGTPIRPVNVAGMALLVLGMALMGR
jgi:multidrug transporter EmrE-like cation transporter